MTKNSIRLNVHDIIEIHVESDELNFKDLKEEALDLFEILKKNTSHSMPNYQEVA